MKYKILYEHKNKIKKLILEANNIAQLTNHTNLPNNIIDIKPIKKFELARYLHFQDKEELLELFYEMGIMLDAKLPFDEVVNILINTKFSKPIDKLLHSIQAAVSSGLPIYKVLEKYRYIVGNSAIVFFKIGEQNSNFAVAVNALYRLLYDDFIIKQKMFKALSYPFVLIISLFVSMGIIFNMIVPKFEYIFAQFDNKLPLSTTIMLWIKDFFDQYYLGIAIIIVLVMGLFVLFYKQYKYFFDKIILLYIPYFSNMYKNIIIYRLFLSISLIVSSKVQFQNALIGSKNISQNFYFCSIIEKIIWDIQNGLSISRSFEKAKIFDNIVIRLLLTAQKTNTMEIILKDITNIYQKKSISTIELFTKFLEPFLIFFIAFIVLWLVLAIMTPVWDLGNIMR